MLGEQDTIAAIATAKGIGALSIVRVSGDQTKTILKKCFNTASSIDVVQSHQAIYGYWCKPTTPEKIDEVLVLYFSPGKGFTGEEACEIICHGGLEITNLVLASCLGAGARLARPGEFTYRAVNNGKLDLAQAESILGIIQARTPRAAAIALRNIQGSLSKKLNDLESEIVFVLANLEASIDFTTEDIHPVSYREMSGRLKPVVSELGDLLATFLPGRVLSRGVRVALVGKPNVGKSSLLNTLLGRDRSIVHDAPGTTRDTVEADLQINGQLFRLIDTAGLRSTKDAVENQGVIRTKEEMQVADVVIYVVDSSAGLSNDDVKQIKTIDPKNMIICFNKADLKVVVEGEEKSRFGLGEYKSVSSFCFSDNGVKTLQTQLSVLGETKSLGGEVDFAITTERQNETLSLAKKSLAEAMELLEQEASPDLVSFSLREGLVRVQGAQGKNIADDIMDRVFREFCIGK